MAILSRSFTKSDKNNHRPLDECNQKLIYFLLKIYVVGTQKNRLNETILLSAHSKYLNCWIRKY